MLYPKEVNGYIAKIVSELPTDEYFVKQVNAGGEGYTAWCLGKRLLKALLPEAFSVIVNYDLPFEDMVAAVKLSYVDEFYINAQNFQQDLAGKKGKVEISVKLMDVKDGITHLPFTFEELQAKRKSPLSLPELLALVAQYPVLLNAGMLVALGSIRPYPNGCGQNAPFIFRKWGLDRDPGLCICCPEQWARTRVLPVVEYDERR